MKKIKYLTFIGLVGLLFSCEKDGTDVIFSDSPVVPTLQTPPDLTLKRANGNNTIEFVGTAVDPGFVASANYFLEACKAGTNFADAIVLYSGISPVSMKMTISDLNGFFLKKFPADQVTSTDLRLRSVLVVDAGTGAPGTSTKPFEYVSAIKTVNVTTYGLPRLDLVNSGITQKIESPLGDGKYRGYVKLDATKAFTLKDPDSGTTYGVTAGKLAANGSAIPVPNSYSGWYRLTADTKTLAFTLEAFKIGVVGSATPNGWDVPDQKMDYVAGTGNWDAMTGDWTITTTFVDGEFKFRYDDAWAWNLGWNSGKTGLTHNGDNIAVTAGKYNITLTITVFSPGGSEAGTFTIAKAN
jgi:starch-binding outer membrane protein SusE/F